MTETDWVNATDPQEMLLFLRNGGRLSPRKARLFAAACCRRLWALLADGRSRAAVEAVEGLADGGGTRLEREVQIAARKAHRMAPEAEWQAALAVREACRPNSFVAAYYVRDYAAWGAPDRASELAGQAALIRDIFGNPFRTLSPLPPSLLESSDGLIVRLAEAAYENRSLPWATSTQTASRSWPMPLRRPASWTPGSWATSANPART